MGAIPVLFAITLHEVAHGWMAKRCGDRTAELLGRLSLNPLKHVDPVGTILVPALMFTFSGFLFGWAKALKPHGIRVNAMCMGATDSHMIRQFYGYADNEEDINPEAKAEIDTWMHKEDSAQVVVDLLKEGPDGRTARNMNLCVGRPVKLEPALPHIYITEEDLNASA